MSGAPDCQAVREGFDFPPANNRPRAVVADSSIRQRQSIENGTDPASSASVQQPAIPQLAGHPVQAVSVSGYYGIHGNKEPVESETGTMPAHKRFGPDDRDGLEDRGKPPIQQNEEQAIAVRQIGPTADHSLQHDQLMSERSVLRLKSAR